MTRRLGEPDPRNEQFRGLPERMPGPVFLLAVFAWAALVGGLVDVFLS